MSSSLLIIASLLVLSLLFTATITITLRRYSRARAAELLRARGREQMMERLVATQHELAQCMAIIRTASTLALVLVVYHALWSMEVDPRRERYVVAFVTTLALFVAFGVAIPSAWSKYAGEAILVRALPFLWIVRAMMFPLLLIAGVFDTLVRRLAGVPDDDGNRDAARHERDLLDAVSEGELVGAVNEEEKEMIESVIELRETDVAEIMTPRTEIRGASTTVSLAEIKSLIGDIGHSRIPIYEETIDNIVGIVYAKDLLHVENAETFTATAIMRSAHFVPETKILRDLLNEFRTQKVHMAIVLDEYGGTAGLVTIEDILEEVVGEIIDEYDEEEPAAFTRIDEHTVEIDARMRVDEINELLDVELPDEEDYETMGGLVFSTMGHIPAAGEHCVHGNVEIHVTEAEPRRINRLRLHIHPESNGRANGG